KPKGFILALPSGELTKWKKDKQNETKKENHNDLNNFNSINDSTSIDDKSSNKDIIRHQENSGKPDEDKKEKIKIDRLDGFSEPIDQNLEKIRGTRFSYLSQRNLLKNEKINYFSTVETTPYLLQVDFECKAN
ncbi:hypothetical protein PV326_013120, partial [Microctonus aethiopoides]